jgi:UDP-galactopyranose mutase
MSLPPVAWFYTPMAVPWIEGLTVSATVYDCMDELSAFANAPEGLRERERALMARADVVFTGGHSLYEAKRGLHPNIHVFPSSVDVTHFAGARRLRTPPDQEYLPGPRIGFCGVIDERMDRDLVRAVAARRPSWHFVMLGPTAKVNPADLPQGPNIHYLGMKPYQDLPAYMAGWDVAMMPFAHNDSTRFISPTKTPEYLAAGCPVVSTSIRDVVTPYGDEGLVCIADTPDAFVAAIEESMTPVGRRRVERAHARLAGMSWDRTFHAMREEVDAVTRVISRRPVRSSGAAAVVSPTPAA